MFFSSLAKRVASTRDGVPSAPRLTRLVALGLLVVGPLAHGANRLESIQAHLRPATRWS